MSRKTRKLIWSAPLVAVFAVVGALAIFAAMGPGSVSANPLPDAPGELTVKTADGDAGRTTLMLSWGAAANASGYRIDKLDGSGAVWETFVMNTGNANTTYTDDTLSAEDTRWYRVFALNSHGIGPVSNAVSGTTDDKVNPGSVMNLTATPNAEMPRKRLDLSWEAPAANGGEMIVGYEIQAHVGGNWVAVSQIGETSPTTGNVTHVTKTSYMDMHDKDPGDKQLYRVRAVNGTEELDPDDVDITASAAGSASKEWVQVTGTTQAATAPGPVTGLTAVNATNDNTINLYWYDPEDTGGWAISGYVIQAHRQGKKFPSAPNVATIKAATFSATAPVLGDATAAPDNATWYQTKAAAGVVQAVFGGIVVTLDTDNDDTADARERWYFRVYAVTTDHGPDNDSTDTTDNVIRRSASPSNTASDTPAARDIDHDDDADTTALDPLAPPTLGATSPTNIPADGKKQQIDLSVTLDTALTSATPPVQQIAYRIDYSKNAGSSWMLLERDTRFTGFGPDRDYEDNDGLGFDESRSYRIFAIGRHPYTDVGPALATVTTGATAASTAPKKPTGVTASSPSLRSVTASWTAPKDNGGQPITKYLVQWVVDDGDGVAEASDFTTNTPADDSTDDAMAMGTFSIAAANALTDDTLYAFRVAGVNELNGTERPASAAAATNWSDPVLFNTTDAAKPTAVEGLTSEAATDTSGTVTGVNLLWNKPSNKIAISDYDIEVEGKDGDWVNPTGGEDWTATNTAYTDPDEPADDEMRKYRVRASNAAGDGPWTMVYYPREPDTHTHVAAEGTIPAQEVTVGMKKTVDAAMYFSDNTGAMYAAESDMEQYATVMADASTGMVTITGVAEGTATITVTATSGAVEAEQEFMVTVGPANNDPMANDMTIEPVMVMAGMSSDPMDVSMYFSDDDDDELTYRAMSNMEQYATADIPEGSSMLTITGVAEGSATVTVYASDGMGGTDAMRTIMVTVTAANAAPMAEGMIDPVTVKVGAMSDPITLGGYFSDADGDTLTYNASSSNNMIAIAEITEVAVDGDPGNIVNRLTITGVGAGSATITVTAMDPRGASATQTITVTVEEELMAPTNVRTDPQGSGLVQVEWDTASGAHGYTVIAINVEDLTPMSKVIDNPDQMVTQITLTQGVTYNIYVGSWAPGGEFEVDLSERKRVIVE